MRVALLGLGLIGGSIARALSFAHGTGQGLGDDGGFSGATIVSWTPSGEAPRKALAESVIAEAAPDLSSAIDGADTVVLAGPPLACLDVVGRLGNELRAKLDPQAVITDVASTKAMIVERAARQGLRFVGGHPMAGRETSGFGAASADLFQGRPWVVVPRAEGEDVAAIERVEALARACGARPVRMAADDHDAAVAAISHLPLVMATALVESVAGADANRGRDRSAGWDWEVARSLAASGWRDMTRLARGDPEMSAGILATNPEPIAANLRVIREVLDRWLADLEGTRAPSNGPTPGGVEPSPEWFSTIRSRFEAARDRLLADDA